MVAGLVAGTVAGVKFKLGRQAANPPQATLSTMTQPPQPQGVLEAGYQLHWYRIGRVLGRGAFGITYLAEDINLDRPVAIKEFFPSQHCTRVGSTEIKPLSAEAAEDFNSALGRFLSEARTLAQFEHPNIIRVINVFERNDTAYMVMNYESGISLSALLKRRRTLNEREIAKLTLPILDGLEKVHANGFIHRDIKPANLYIRETGSPVLLDFGSARQSMQAHTQTLTSLVSPGYAPIEQYTSKGERQGPWTDIYGLAATLYRTVTGLVPPSAIDRSEALSEGKQDFMTHARDLVREPYSEQFLNAIDHALAFRIEDRPQNISDWRSEFDFDSNDMDTQPVYYGEPVAVRGNSSPTRTNTPTAPLMAEKTEPQPQDSGLIDSADSQSTQPDDEADTVVSDDPDEDNDNGAKRHFYWWPVAAAVLALTVVAYLWQRPAAPLPAATGKAVIEATPAMPIAENAKDPVGMATVADTEPTDEQRIADLLKGARADLEALRLTTPVESNAHDKFLAVQAIDPDNPQAKRGIKAIYDRYVQMAQLATQEKKFDLASQLLDKAESVTPDAPGLIQARVALEQRRTQARMESLSQTIEKRVDTPNDSGIKEEAADTDVPAIIRDRFNGESQQ